jgi:hypothetical protein
MAIFNILSLSEFNGLHNFFQVNLVVVDSEALVRALNADGGGLHARLLNLCL